MKISLVNNSVEHAELLYQWVNEPLSKKFNPLLKSSLEDIRKRLSHVSSDLKDDNFNEYGWFIKADETLVGRILVKSVNHTMKLAEIGYGIAEKFHGRGIGTEAVGLVIKKVFDETDVFKV